MGQQSFYRKYIAGVVFQANKQQNQEYSDLIYNELSKWLRNQNIRLEKEMFKAVLATSRSVTKEYLSSGNIEINEACNFYAMCFHTFTGKDGIHTSPKLLKKYMNNFFPVLQARLDEEKNLGDINVRYRKVDVVRLGKLFDQILKYTDENKASQVIDLMDEFVKSDLEECKK